MSTNRETNLALFIDFDNVALGARDARQRFDVKLLLQRLLEKGKVIVKKAYADWHFYKEYMSPLHEAAIELIEIPMPKISGKNSADIKLVVDAMDLCYSKDHIDTFVIVSGDSDFSPLVSKLRENDKRVIGVGVKNSSSKLLIGNCDEFIFYDDIYRQATDQGTKSAGHVPLEKRDLFDFLVSTAQSLLQESRGVLYSSLIKDTMTRKKPDFNERAYGYSTFGDLLDEARKLGLLVVERDARAGGTWVVQGLGSGVGAQGQAPLAVAEKAPAKNGGSRSGRRRRRSGDRPAGSAGVKTPGEAAQPRSADQGPPAGEAGPARGREEIEYGRPTGRAAEAGPTVPSAVPSAAAGSGSGRSPSPAQPAPAPAAAGDQPGQQVRKKVRRQRDGLRRSAAPKPAAQKPAPQKAPASKDASGKDASGKDAAPKASAPKSPARRTTAKKAPVKKPASRKKVARKAEPKAGGSGQGGES